MTLTTDRVLTPHPPVASPSFLFHCRSKPGLMALISSFWIVVIYSLAVEWWFVTFDALSFHSFVLEWLCSSDICSQGGHQLPWMLACGSAWWFINVAHGSWRMVSWTIWWNWNVVYMLCNLWKWIQCDLTNKILTWFQREIELQDTRML